MGNRDYRHREVKKPKKDAKRGKTTAVAPETVQVQVIPKGKRAKELE